MASVAALIALASRSGLTLRMDGEHLVIRGPRSAEPIARAVLARKPEILYCLAEAERRRGEWARLSALRWGRAVGDPTSGLDVGNEADHGRVLAEWAAERALTTGGTDV